MRSTSDILYEAACRTSDVSRERYTQSKYEYSCHAVTITADGTLGRIKLPLVTVVYAESMAPSEDIELSPFYVDDAAEQVNWHVQDYRTFMLLMASEAFK